MTTYFVSRLELERVQTYLFEVPRLSVMLGANVLLGELIRGIWTGGQFVDGDPNKRAPSLPALAVRCGSRFPQFLDDGENYFPLNWLEQFSEKVLGIDLHNRFCTQDAADDPLRIGEIVQDDPFEIATQTGVLVRDASRIEAVFPDLASARKFLEQAQQMLLESIPGIGMGASIWQIDGDEGTGTGKSDEVQRIERTVGSEIAFDLPDTKACELSQHAAAQAQIRLPGNESMLVTTSIKNRHDAAQRFNAKKSSDILGLMYDSIFPDDKRLVTEFAQLAQSGLAAIIHADGNRVGRRPRLISDALGTLEPKPAKNSILEWSVREAMFLNNRRSVRRALADSIQHLTEGKDRGDRPREGVSERIRLLMLGGDDILIVCDAPLAVPLVIRACELLTKFSACELRTASLNEAFEPLTLGVGIAFVKPSLPFRRGHELAEQLASSAKRLALRYPKSHVIDWCVSKNSWLETPDISRRNEFVSQPSSNSTTEYLLSGRPYRVSAPQKEWAFSKIWNDAQALAAESAIARSQLRSLEAALVSGPASAVVAIQDLPVSLRCKLRSKGYLFDTENGLMNSVWEDCGKAPPSQEVPEPQINQKLNRLLDLIELYEIARLDQAAKKEADRPTAGVGATNHE